MAGVEQDRIALDRELARLLADGEKIAAIKLLRERTGMGLAEAKDTVDRAMAASGGRVLAQRAPAAPAGAPQAWIRRPGALRALLTAVALGVALWYALH